MCIECLLASYLCAEVACFFCSCQKHGLLRVLLSDTEDEKLTLGQELRRKIILEGKLEEINAEMQRLRMAE